MKTPPKPRIRYHLLELTQALLENLEYFEGNTIYEPHFAASAKSIIENACRNILQEIGIRQYQYDKGTQKYIDITHFNKSERQKFEQAQNKIKKLENLVTDLKDKIQHANNQSAKDKHNLSQLKRLILGKLTLAIERFERANPVVSIKANLRELILEETKDVQELLQ